MRFIRLVLANFRIPLGIFLLSVLTLGNHSALGQSGTPQSKESLQLQMVKAESLLHVSPDSSLQLYHLTIREANKIGDDGLLYDVWISLAKSYHIIGNFPAAFEACQNALAFCQAAQPECPLEAYQLMGILQADNGNPHLAIPYFEKAKRLAFQLNQTDIGYRLQMQMGVVYVMQEQYKKADSLFWIGLDYARSVRDSSMLSICYNNLGDLSLKTHNLSAAEQFFQKALQARKRSPSQDPTSIYLNLGLLSLAKGDFAEAERFGMEGLATAEAAKHLLKQRNAYEVIWQAQEKLGRTEDAFVSFQKMVELERSLFSVDKAVQIAGLETRALLTEKTEEIELRDFLLEDKEAQIRSNRRWLVIFAGIVLVLVAIVLVILLQKRRKPLSDNLSILPQPRSLSNQLAPWRASFFDAQNEAIALEGNLLDKKSGPFLAMAYLAGAKPKIQALDVPLLFRELLFSLKGKAQRQFASVISDFSTDIPVPVSLEGNSLSALILLLLDATLDHIPNGKLKVQLGLLAQESVYVDLELILTATPGNLPVGGVHFRPALRPIWETHAKDLSTQLGGKLDCHFGDDGYIKVVFSFRGTRESKE